MDEEEPSRAPPEIVVRSPTDPPSDRKSPSMFYQAGIEELHRRPDQLSQALIQRDERHRVEIENARSRSTSPLGSPQVDQGVHEQIERINRQLDRHGEQINNLESRSNLDLSSTRVDERTSVEMRQHRPDGRQQRSPLRNEYPSHEYGPETHDWQPRSNPRIDPVNTEPSQAELEDLPPPRSRERNRRRRAGTQDSQFPTGLNVPPLQVNNFSHGMSAEVSRRLDEPHIQAMDPPNISPLRRNDRPGLEAPPRQPNETGQPPPRNNRRPRHEYGAGTQAPVSTSNQPISSSRTNHTPIPARDDRRDQGGEKQRKAEVSRRQDKPYTPESNSRREPKPTVKPNPLPGQDPPPKQKPPPEPEPSKCCCCIL